MDFNIRLNIGDTVSTINIEANTFFEAINKAQQLYEIMGMDSDNMSLCIKKIANNRIVYPETKREWIVK